MQSATHTVAIEAAPAADRRVRIEVWDWPTRAFHWALVLAVSVAIASAQVGGEWMKLHGWAGLSVLGLVSFRVVWGFVGSTHSRFASFWPGLRRLQAYFQGRWRGVGHSPLGGLAIFVLLGLLAAQALTGLFSNDDIAFTGPWAASVSDTLSEWLTGWHHRLSNALYGLIGLHLAAIAVYVGIKKQQLVRPMLTGRKDFEGDDPPPQVTVGRPVKFARAFALALIVASAVVWLANGAPWPVGSKPVDGAPAAEPAMPAW